MLLWEKRVRKKHEIKFDRLRRNALDYVEIRRNALDYDKMHKRVKIHCLILKYVALGRSYSGVRKLLWGREVALGKKANLLWGVALDEVTLGRSCSGELLGRVEIALRSYSGELLGGRVTRRIYSGELLREC